MASVIFYNHNGYSEYSYNLEKDYEELIKNNAKLIFGSSSIYIDLKTRIDTISLGGSKPDGILFDLINIEIWFEANILSIDILDWLRIDLKLVWNQIKISSK